MVFSRGDVGSVCLAMEQFAAFSKVTGLEANVKKSTVFFSGVYKWNQDSILEVTGFMRGQLPFRYLGVPLDSKRISINECALLIDKITGRMKHWSSNLRSYASRLQLIRSVVTSIISYWLQVFPIPKKVLKHIESICRSFLWSGKEVITKKAPVAWEKICHPKNSGGLNVVDLGV